VYAAEDLASLEDKIDSWHLTEARRILERLDAATRDKPKARYLFGRLLFHEGDYARALEELRRAIESARAEMSWKALRDVAEQSNDVFSGMVKIKGRSGRFVYRFEEGPDSLLIPYAEETLSKQLDALAVALGDRPNFPIEIDIMPEIEDLAGATGLTVEQIERTGTVGVTKFARVMIISPRRLAAGYPWLDTLAHELTHLIITRASRNRSPIWLHEGVAKLFERLWRNEAFGSLTPEEAYLLDRAAREGRLIPLRRFHPSVAHMPNQEDAALAYAQVLSLMLYLNEKLGEQWTRRLMESLASGKSIDQAFADLSQFNIRRYYTWWRQAVSGRRQTPVPAVGLMKRKFKRGKTTGERGLESLLSLDVRRHLRVGDLLRLRGHVKAAVKEYRSAEGMAESPYPEISDRLAACLLELGDNKAVLEMLPRMAVLYPAHSTIFVQLGQALAAEARSEDAIAAMERANAINPFHPTVHCLLKDLYRRVGEAEAAELEEKHCQLLASYQQGESLEPVETSQ
jgi:tetratricopeptide (TPR) repeat protein